MSALWFQLSTALCSASASASTCLPPSPRGRRSPCSSPLEPSWYIRSTKSSELSRTTIPLSTNTHFTSRDPEQRRQRPWDTVYSARGNLRPERSEHERRSRRREVDARVPRVADPRVWLARYEAVLRPGCSIEGGERAKRVEAPDAAVSSSGQVARGIPMVRKE